MDTVYYETREEVLEQDVGFLYAVPGQSTAEREVDPFRKGTWPELFYFHRVDLGAGHIGYEMFYDGDEEELYTLTAPDPEDEPTPDAWVMTMCVVERYGTMPLWTIEKDPNLGCYRVTVADDYIFYLMRTD